MRGFQSERSSIPNWCDRGGCPALGFRVVRTPEWGQILLTQQKITRNFFASCSTIIQETNHGDINDHHSRRNHRSNPPHCGCRYITPQSPFWQCKATLCTLTTNVVQTQTFVDNCVLTHNPPHPMKRDWRVLGNRKRTSCSRKETCKGRKITTRGIEEEV